MNLFLLLNFAVVTVLIYLFLKDRRKKPSPSKFNINRKGKPLDFGFFRGRTRQLNLLFNFNGETWDAYEILGIPAGSSFEEVENAYKNHALKTEIVKAAFEAIKEESKKTKEQI